jgi:hypothetical protein
MKVIRCLGLASGELQDDGKYLESYDPEAFDGRGLIQWTEDKSKAMQLTVEGAYDLYNTVPSCHPVRLTDGKPNKPLTAFHIQIEEA